MRLTIAAILVLAAGAAVAQQVPRPPTRPPAPPGPPLIACPPHLQVETGDTPVVPQGWTLRPERQTHFLRGADLFEGDPAELAQLRPEEDRRARREWWDIYDNGRPYFLICRYEGLEAGIQGEVPRAAKRCEVRTVRSDGRGVRFGREVTGPERVEVDCR